MEPIFKPEKSNDLRNGQASGLADSRGGRFYHYHDSRIEKAVNLAFATERPLLIKGPSGCGKSSLAFNIALQNGLRYYRFVVRSDSKAQDLAWHYDAIRRLGDAQAAARVNSGDAQAAASVNSGKDAYLTPGPYVEPGVLWWAFSSGTVPDNCVDPNGNEDASKPGSVVLIDEIDKADPNFANDLLIPFGEYRFTVSETRKEVKLVQPEDEELNKKTWDWAPLLVITTNSERHLPDAFLRRCITLEMRFPDAETLALIARDTLCSDLAIEVFEEWAEKAKSKHEPSIPEFIDLAKACINLKLKGRDLDEELFGMLMSREQ